MAFLFFFEIFERILTLLAQARDRPLSLAQEISEREEIVEFPATTNRWVQAALFNNSLAWMITTGQMFDYFVEI